MVDSQSQTRLYGLSCITCMTVWYGTLALAMFLLRSYPVMYAGMKELFVFRLLCYWWLPLTLTATCFCRLAFHQIKIHPDNQSGIELANFGMSMVVLSWAINLVVLSPLLMHILVTLVANFAGTFREWLHHEATMG